jgi:hypothetical protein
LVACCDGVAEVIEQTAGLLCAGVRCTNIPFRGIRWFESGGGGNGRRDNDSVGIGNRGRKFKFVAWRPKSAVLAQNVFFRNRSVFGFFENRDLKTGKRYAASR